MLNKYIPPDFDPSKIPRSKKGTGAKAQQKVRMMLPMTICCSTCGNYITKGTKFNARKEDAIGEEYLGLTIFRFYFRCNRCSAEIAMKTDPKNADYVVEAGASRNFEPWRERDELVKAAEDERDAEEEGDTMKALENRTKESKREMDITAALDEMRSLNARHAGISHADAIAALRAKDDTDRAARERAEELAAKRIFDEANAATAGFVRRLEDSDSDERSEGEGGRKGAVRGGGGGGGGGDGGGTDDDSPAAPDAKRMRRSAEETTEAAPRRGGPKPTFAARPTPPNPAITVRVVAKKKQPAEAPEAREESDEEGGGLGLLGDYGSDASP